MELMTDKIRNFVIIAHIDHGKSTLADRFLELTKTVDKREMRPQYLDRLESERERGITIKMAPVRMNWQGYILNLIDTPGHSDFSYEVSRALAAVEGAILLVDVSQGIQAQTLVNLRLAQRAGLKIIGAVNKIDLFSDHKEMVDKAIKELADLLDVQESEILRISGKTGEGAEELLNAAVHRFPSPREKTDFSQALIFDSFYDDHKGVIAFVRVMSGEYRGGKEAKLMATNHKFKIKEVGYFSPDLKPTEILATGEIGYIATGIKNPDVLRIGDTVINADLRRFSTQINADIRENPRLDPRESASLALPGYKEPNPVVFVSLYPASDEDYDDLKKALQKLKLNDSSLSFGPDFNEVLGRGFKCGFLGQLHFEITAERLEKEFKIKTVSTFPSVAYKVKIKHGDDYVLLKNIEDLPNDFHEVLEPMIKMEIITPTKFLGGVLQLKEIFRIKEIETSNLGDRIIISAKMPLGSLIADFDGQLKSVSEGMASFSYEIAGEEQAGMEKVEVLVADEPVAGLTRLIYKDELETESRKILLKLKDILPRQQFSQALQARAGSRIIARENIPALRKDVTGYLYGGDRTRKMKLWKKQQRGKKKLKEIGRVTLSANVFKELLKK